jgi:hypothetical protein
MSDSDLQHAVMALLKAAGELSDAQAALDATPDLTTAPRDFAVRKVCDAFRAFESGAKAITKPTRISITLSPRVPNVVAPVSASVEPK